MSSLNRPSLSVDYAQAVDGFPHISILDPV